MDRRSVQKSGNMQYMYLPTIWCKKHHIGPNSRIDVLESPEGDLVLSVRFEEKPSKEVSIVLEKCSEDALQKLIMACYVNPTKAFRIKIKNSSKLEKLLNQKNMFGIELIEIDGNSVSCESTISIDDPLTTLKTMIRRIRTLIYIMATDFNPETIKKYEDEIDREKVLIEKAIISSLTFQSLQKIKPADMYYVSKISKSIESAADNLIELAESDKKFFEEILPVIDKLKEIMDAVIAGENSDSMLLQSINFIDSIGFVKNFPVKDMNSYYKMRLRRHLTDISEDIIDWAVTKKIEKEFKT